MRKFSSFSVLWICLIVLSSNTFSQSTSIFEQYRIPTFSFKTLSVSGQDFLNYQSTGSENNHFQMSLGAWFLWEKQDPMLTINVFDAPSFDYHKAKVNGVDRDAVTHFDNLLGLNYQNYFTDDYKGLFGYTDALFIFQSRSDSLQRNNGEWATTNTGLPLEVGLGYGRVVGVRNVAQALAISSELNLDLSDAQTLQLAQVIEKNDNGFYYFEYKDDADIEFYKDINRVIGKEANPFKIQQILFSSVYRISEKYVGWEARVGYSNVFLDEGTFMIAGEDYSSKGSVAASFRYAKPIDFNQQFYGSLEYLMSLEDKDKMNPANTIALNLSYSYDHSYKWASSVNLMYEMYSFDQPVAGEDSYTSYGINARTDYYILNKLGVYGSLSYELMEADRFGNVVIPTGIEDATIRFTVGFRYWVF